MHITILGDRDPSPVADQQAFLLGLTLSALGHRLSVGGSKAGVAEAVRRGASGAPRRHVRTYYVEAIDPAVQGDRSGKNGYYFFEQPSVLDRFSLVSNASAIIFLGLNRANVGTALNLLFEQRQSTRGSSDLHIAERLLLFHHNAIPNRELEDLRKTLGSFVDMEDWRSLTTFRTTREALKQIGAWAERPLKLA